MFDSERALIARMAALEAVKSAAAAEQAELAVQFEKERCEREIAAGIPASRRGRGIAGEIALARKDSPNRGGRHLGFAKALVFEMPHTLAALKANALSEWRATLIVRESACLSVEDRGELDRRMCADTTELEGLGDKRIEARAREIAYELDPQAFVDRAVKKEAERTVSVRPAPDNMAYVTALVPMPKGVGIFAALKRQADVACDGRGRGQVMADTLYERVTGRPAEAPVPIAVDLVITDETLLAGDTTPARVPGYGPIPAAIACQLTGDAILDERSKATLRRLYRHPASGALVAMESRARLFPKGLAQLIAFRDDTCRTPYCDAPIRHTDHAQPHAADGPTSELNGLGACEACNYTKESPGWRVVTARQRDGTHTADVTTPTGNRYRSKAPPLPGRRTRPSRVETVFADDLAWADAVMDNAA
ncbi:HNH endonuclease [Mycolicibacterium arenosum]|uniref:13E12 repeat family protein n=1 Tax=Mycolicibacterium arenosum TaxID=2952157 RepID=A0ABT1M1F9_9MYCO|nr:13E12 repeat family protein [Mycolicibacterium sp. CAU 1645]MCP9271692.1 13E12 repeat family protein [Mycolicibacterium sp. CAU 1645]